jgi:hypothetical protein
LKIVQRPSTGIVDMSKINIKCRHCNSSNAIHGRFCVSCGRQLNGPQPWPMCGCNAQRVPLYINSTNGGVPEQRYPIHSHSNPSDLNDLPQPVFAFDTLWYWNLSERTLSGLELKPRRDNGWVKKQTGIASDIPLSYANSLCFDGVFIDGIVEGAFFRVSMYNGDTVTQIHDDAITVSQKTAPLVTNYKNPDSPYRPFRYFIASLKDHVLVVDIARKGDENYVLIPWENAYDNEELRTPVQKGQYAYCLSSTGRMLKIDISHSLESLVKAVEKHSSWVSFPKNMYLAPVIVGQSLVCEALSKIKSSHRQQNKQVDWYQRSLFTMPLDEPDRHNYQLIEDFHSDKSIAAEGHFPSLSDGKRIYIQCKRRGDIFQSLPAKKPVKRRLRGFNADLQLPIISARNSLLIKDQLHVFDARHCQVHKFKLQQGQWTSAIQVSTGKDLRQTRPRLHAQPIAFANVMALIFGDQVYFCDISKDQ